MSEQVMMLPAGSEPDPQRRLWLTVATGAAGAAAIGTAVPFVSTLTPSERAKAAGAPIEVDIANLAPGELRVVEWRGKPVWILRRTPEMVAALKAANADLVDPSSARQQQPDYATNAYRSIEPDVFVAVGICTHLGCSPSMVKANSGNPSVPATWQGGFLCPCHGSTFDLAGRVFKNKPAPTNLEIPPHRYLSATRLLIGEDASGVAA